MNQNDDDGLKFPEWLTDEWLAELEQLGFDWDIDWDGMGRVTLYIKRMADKDRKEWEEWQRLHIALGKITRWL